MPAALRYWFQYYWYSIPEYHWCQRERKKHDPSRPAGREVALEPELRTLAWIPVAYSRRQHRPYKRSATPQTSNAVPTEHMGAISFASYTLSSLFLMGYLSFQM